MRKRVEKIASGVSEAIDRTRMLARGLSPVALESNGLLSALQELTDDMRQLFGIDCAFQSKGKIAIDHGMVATHLYRITQEAINNALKHGRPSRLRVSLENQGGKIALIIQDNGAGFAVGSAGESRHGLAHHRLSGGNDRRRSPDPIEAGAGTTIICTFSPNE